MKTCYTIIKPDGSKFEDFAMLAEEPNYDDLAKVMNPIFREQRGGARFERVAVLGDDGQPTDMFVDDMGLIYDLDWNREATIIYHRAQVKRGASHIGGVVIGGSPIAGVAVLWGRRVWF